VSEQLRARVAVWATVKPRHGRHGSNQPRRGMTRCPRGRRRIPIATAKRQARETVARLRPTRASPCVLARTTSMARRPRSASSSGPDTKPRIQYHQPSCRWTAAAAVRGLVGPERVHCCCGVHQRRRPHPTCGAGPPTSCVVQYRHMNVLVRSSHHVCLCF
jgi:hypothetical protein